jgi:hypothetical protein
MRAVERDTIHVPLIHIIRHGLHLPMVVPELECSIASRLRSISQRGALVGLVLTHSPTPPPPPGQVEMMVENIAINNNVLHAANECGVDRCVSMTSTCVFPDKVSTQTLPTPPQSQVPVLPSPSLPDLTPDVNRRAARCDVPYRALTPWEFGRFSTRSTKT